MYSELDRLLTEAEELNMDASDNNYNDLPRVERNLSQVFLESQEMRSRLHQPSDNNAVQANLLLSSCGVNLPQMSERLESISAQQPFELLEPSVESDISKQIDDEWQTNYLSVIEKSNKYISDKVTIRAFEQVCNSWKRDFKIFSDTCACPTGNANDFKVALKSSAGNWRDRFTLQQYTQAESKALDRSKFMLPIEFEFAKVIQRYNERAVRGEMSPVNLFPMLREVVEKVPDSSGKEIWRLVEFMSQLPIDLDTIDRNNYRCKDEIIMAIIKRAKMFLESRYKTFMENVVSDNLEIAQRGGIPGVLSLVLAFINVRLRSGYPTMTEDEKYDNRPLWPVVYYCLRAGDIKAVLHVLSSVSGDQFANIKAFIEHKIRSENADYHADSSYAKMVQKRLVEEHDHVRASYDIYKRAVYIVLVGTQPDPHLDSKLFNTTDDDLWYKLCIVSEQGTLTNADENSFSFNNIQTIIFEECGEGYYKPQVYFELLILTGQFEAAIEYLWRTDLLQRPNVVHLAIALYEINLLNITKSIQAPVLQKEWKSKNTVFWLNLPRILLTYTHSWEANECLYAMHYFYLLRHIFNTDNVSFWFSEITRLVKSTGNIDLIFGKLDFKPMSNGVFRSDGLIDNFGMEPTQLTSLINHVGQQLEDNCSFEDAITVYNLSRNEQKVLTLSCQLLYQILSMDSTNDESTCIRDRFLKRCRQFLAVQYPLPASNSGTNTTQVLYGFHMLLKYADALELFTVNRLHQALDLINEMGVLPISIDDVEVKVKAVITLYVYLRHMLPDIMLIAMKILHNLSKTIESGMDKIDCADFEYYTKLLKCYKDRAKGITSFAGMLPIAVSNDFCSNLIRLEIDMN